MNVFGLTDKEQEILDLLEEDIAMLEYKLKVESIHLAKMREVRNKFFSKAVDSAPELPFINNLLSDKWKSSGKITSDNIVVNSEIRLDERWNKIAKELGVGVSEK